VEKMKIHYMIVICALALISACAAQYKEPSAGQPSAMLNIKTNHSAASTANVFLVCADGACEGYECGPQLAVFNWANPNEKTVRLIANERIRIKAIASNALTGAESMGGGMVKIQGSECMNTVSFIPITGHSYKIQQQLSASNCKIELIDTHSLKPPESMGE
jgi:hypothetical protein